MAQEWADDSTIVFTKVEFDALLVKMQDCVSTKYYWESLSLQQDSLINLQDSLIAQYEYKDNLVAPFYKQKWFHNLMFTLTGMVIKDKIEEAIND